MKKFYVLLIIASTILFQFCATKKGGKSKKAAKITYTANMAGIITSNCAPCHIPPKGNKEPLNTYAALKANIDESIIRINRNPGEKGFMPQRHPKLSDSLIHVFVQWKADGLLEN
ncbi:hypothetical protein [Hufsiella ginkgonis]|uniref:Cytochrome c n=1 Tax=Hufsiella ginkgonis TaxID=2695274 RepID=A0A7K1Y242_9SPHI|nr:hypothetical protein [Hufsiella ginkgonis]MXV17330.1 hypothetical protein [Hufsiella ginkgonis]